LSYGSLIWLGLLVAVPVVATAFYLGLQQMKALEAFEAELNAVRGRVIAAPLPGELLNAKRTAIREAASALSSTEAGITQNRGA